MQFKLLGIATTLLLVSACSSMHLASPMAEPAPASTQAAVAAPATPTHLIAMLPMRDGFGPADQDAYENRIAPIAAEHGMRRESAYTVTKFLGGAGPQRASTLGTWSLSKPSTLQDVMGDRRYQANVSQRDRVHDMANVAMYLTSAEVTTAAPPSGHTQLVAVLATKPGFGYDDHVSYEQSISAIAERHGMHLVRSYRVLQPMGAGIKNAVAVAVWDLKNSGTLGEVMRDPQYVAHIAQRDRIHDMAATTMYLATPRTTQ